MSIQLPRASGSSLMGHVVAMVRHPWHWPSQLDVFVASEVGGKYTLAPRFRYHPVSGAPSPMKKDGLIGL